MSHEENEYLTRELEKANSVSINIWAKSMTGKRLRKKEYSSLQDKQVLLVEDHPLNAKIAIRC